jgi:hypothetical protein
VSETTIQQIPVGDIAPSPAQSIRRNIEKPASDPGEKQAAPAKKATGKKSKKKAAA